jgi:two-component system LytT family response regulator
MGFFRVHHSHIINLNFLQKYNKGEGGSVVMDNGHEVEVSRRRKDDFLKAISRQN